MRAAMKAVSNWLESSSLNGTNGRISTISASGDGVPEASCGSWSSW